MDTRTNASTKEHLLLGVMIILAFFILTTQYNPEVLPDLNLGHIPTGAAITTEVSLGSMAVLIILMLIIIVGVIAGIVIWLRRNGQRALKTQLQEVDAIISDAQQKSTVALDPLTRKLHKVEHELQNVPIRSATKGHIINTMPAEYKLPAPRKKSSLRHLLPRKHHRKKQRAAVRKAVHEVHRISKKLQHRHKWESLQEKMIKIKKEINKIKTKG